MIGVRFYKTNWRDVYSIGSWIIHSLKTGKAPVYTHASVRIDDIECMLSDKGVVCYCVDHVDIIEDYIFHSIEFDLFLIENILIVYELTKIRITLIEVINFLVGRHSNNCVTFVLCVLGFEVSNMTVDRLYEFISEQDNQATT